MISRDEVVGSNFGEEMNEGLTCSNNRIGQFFSESENKWILVNSRVGMRLFFLIVLFMKVFLLL